ncbi:MAG: type II and III secretion system protein family protein [Thermoguttaceae bacterium]
MSMRRLGGILAASALVFVLGAATITAQEQAPRPDSSPIVHRVGETDRLEMTVNTGRILTLEQKIAQAQVHDPEILVLTPLSPNQVQIWAKKTGITRVTLWDDRQESHSISVSVNGDCQELAAILRAEFPNVTIRVRSIKGSVVLSGRVDEAEEAMRIMRVAEAYYVGEGGTAGGGAASGGAAGGSGGNSGAAGGADPSGGRVINNLTISGVQTVLLHVKVLEVSRTKLRTAGFDFAQLANSGGSIASGIADMAGAANGISASATPAPNMTLGTNPTMAFRVVGAGGSFFGFLNFLRQNNLVKVLAEPTLTTASGRPAYFVVGGELPYAVSQGLGAVSYEWKRYGTKVDFVPIVLGNGRLRLEVRPSISEIDDSRVTAAGAPPALTLREVDAGVEMRAGETLSIAGLVQTQVEASNRGVPIISDIPYLGALFRTVSDQKNEIETLILVTPELVEPMAPHEVPPFGPGQQTTNPSDWQLYVNGELEVPNPACQPNGCPTDPRAVPMAPVPLGGPSNLYNPPGPHPPVTKYSDPADSRGLPRFPGPIGYDEP